MALVRNVWGGSFEVVQSKTEDEDEGDDDRRAYRSEEEQVMEESWLLRREKKKRICETDPAIILRTLLLVVCVAGVITLVVLYVTRWRHHEPVSVHDNYAVALRQALNFFNAQRSGRLPQQNNVSWRGDSGLKDEIVGGYYDGGDTVKYSFPASFAMTMLSWSVIEYSAKYDAIGELDHVKGIIRWGTDYLLKTFNSSADSIGSVVAQVGGERDLYCWMRPEDMDGDKDLVRSATMWSSCPALAAEMAAALAAASIVFQGDVEYSKKLVHGAKILFKFATRDQGENYAGGADPSSTNYNSSGFWDEFVWGGAWLYFATGKSTYLQLVTSPALASKSDAFDAGPVNSVLSWDNKQAGAHLLLARMRIFLGYGYPYEEMLSKYQKHVEDIMCSYLPAFSRFERTKGGLIWLNRGRPRPLQYVVNAAFLASLYRDYLEAELIPGWNCGPRFFANEVLHDFASSQMDYILGKNPRGMSYVVGFGNNFPQHVHHRGASFPNNNVKHRCTEGWKWRDSREPNPNVIAGAMVAGPDKDDGFLDIRVNYSYTEPTIAGNAGLVAAIVALSGGSTSKIDKNTIFHGIAPFYSYEPLPPVPLRQ